MKQTPLKSRSKKEGARLRRYQRARGIVYERSGGSCEARTPDCGGECQQVHHRQGRDGDLIDNLDLLLGVCLSCHNYIHSHPQSSYTNGWLVRRNGETA